MPVTRQAGGDGSKKLERGFTIHWGFGCERFSFIPSFINSLIRSFNHKLGNISVLKKKIVQQDKGKGTNSLWSKMEKNTDKIAI